MRSGDVITVAVLSNAGTEALHLGDELLASQ